jgi:rubrerythrin
MQGIGKGFTLCTLNPGSAPVDAMTLCLWKDVGGVKPAETTPDDLTLGDIVAADITALSNLVQYVAPVPPRDWKAVEAAPIFVRDNPDDSKESLGSEPRRKVEESPDGKKRIVLRGDAATAEQAHEEWLRSQGQGEGLTIEEQRKEARLRRDAAARQEAAARNEDLKVSTERWNGLTAQPKYLGGGTYSVTYAKYCSKCGHALSVLRSAGTNCPFCGTYLEGERSAP